MINNIICFHGCGQRADLFKSLLKSLENNNKQHNWIYLQGKHYKGGGGGWGWYKYNDDNIDQSKRRIDILDMIEIIRENESKSGLAGKPGLAGKSSFRIFIRY
jgi:predicted esterase